MRGPAGPLAGAPDKLSSALRGELLRPNVGCGWVVPRPHGNRALHPEHHTGGPFFLGIWST